MNRFEESEKFQDEKYERDLNDKLNILLARYSTLNRNQFKKEIDYWRKKREILQKVLEIYTEIKVEGFDLNYEDYTKSKEDIKRIEFYIDYAEMEEETITKKRQIGPQREPDGDER